MSHTLIFGDDSPLWSLTAPRDPSDSYRALWWSAGWATITNRASWVLCEYRGSCGGRENLKKWVTILNLGRGFEWDRPPSENKMNIMGFIRCSIFVTHVKKSLCCWSSLSVWWIIWWVIFGIRSFPNRGSSHVGELNCDELWQPDGTVPLRFGILFRLFPTLRLQLRPSIPPRSRDDSLLNL